jgi:hypothetical protein
LDGGKGGPDAVVGNPTNLYSVTTSGNFKGAIK